MSRWHHPASALPHTSQAARNASRSRSPAPPEALAGRKDLATRPASPPKRARDGDGSGTGSEDSGSRDRRRRRRPQEGEEEKKTKRRPSPSSSESESSGSDEDDDLLESLKARALESTKGTQGKGSTSFARSDSVEEEK